MKALVLGGTRFVGLHLVRLLHRHGHGVTVLNRGRTGTELPDGVARLRADRSDPDSVASALEGQSFDTVFDISGYRPSEVEPVVRALEGRTGHYVFCSSVAVYATGEVAPIGEDAPLDRGPAGDYGRDKILCEDLLLEWSDRRGFPSTIVRPPYVYGPDDHIGRRLFSVFARLSQGRSVIVPGEGATLNHSVHVDDLASAFAAVAGRSEAFGRAYNVAGPQAITLAGYVRLVASVMQAQAEIVRVGAGEYERMLDDVSPESAAEICDFGWLDSQVYSTEKLRRDLGWSAAYHIRDGVRMTYRWWLEQGLDRARQEFPADDRALAWLASRRAG